MKKILLLLVVLCVICASASSWNKQDTKKSIESINASQTKKGQWKNLLETNAAITTLLTLGVTNINKDKQICTFLSDALKKDIPVSKIYHAVSSFKNLKCTGEVPSQASEAVKKLLSNTDKVTTEDLYYAIETIDLLGGPDKIGGAAIGKLVDVIVDRMEDRGTFRSIKSENDASVLNAGYAFAALAQLYEFKINKSDQKDMLEASVEALADLFKLANKDEAGSMYFSDEKKDFLETTSVVLNGIFRLLESIPKAKPPPKFSASLPALAQFFWKAKRTSGNPSEIFYVVQALNLLSTNNFNRPISISVQNPSLSTSASGDDRFIFVEAGDALGNAIKGGVKVYIVKAKAARGADIVERQLMEAVSTDAQNTLYRFNLLAVKPSPGSYQLTIRVVPETKSTFEPTSINIDISIVTSVSVFQASLVVSDTESKDHSSAKTYNLDVNSKEKKVVSTTHTQHLLVFFRIKNEKTGKPILISQAFLQFRHSSGDEIVLAAIPTGTLYKLHVDLSSNSFFGQGGTFTISLIIGDSFIEKCIQAELIDFELPETGKASSSQQMKKLWETKPIINHIFRLPEKRAPATISLAFSAIVLSPILVIFVGLGITGFSFGNLSIFGSLNYLLFLACIVAVAGVIVIFWLALTMFQALYFIGIALVPTLFFGQQALRSRALLRLKKND